LWINAPATASDAAFDGSPEIRAMGGGLLRCALEIFGGILITAPIATVAGVRKSDCGVRCVLHRNPPPADGTG
jgi:hypothetical protein